MKTFAFSLFVLFATLATPAQAQQSVASEFMEVNQMLNGEAERIDLLEVGLERDLGRLRGTLRGLADGQEALRAELGAHIADAEARLAEIPDLRQDIADLRGLADRGTATDNELRSLINGLVGRVSSLETRVTDLERRVTGLANRVADLESRMTVVEDEQEEFDFHLVGAAGYLQTGELSGFVSYAGFAFDLLLSPEGNVGLQIDILPAGVMVHQYGESFTASGGLSLLAGWDIGRFLVGYRAGVVVAPSDGSLAQFHHANLGADFRLGLTGEASRWYVQPTFQAGWGKSVVADMAAEGRSLGTMLNLRAEF